MKKFLLAVSVFLLMCQLVSPQKIPADSLWLGQSLPGLTPKRFDLPVNSGSFVAERIAVSKDGKEIYYTEVKSYYPATGDTIRCFRYSDDQWTGPFNLFPGFLSPALSVTGDTIYLQTAGSEYETFIALKIGNEWSSPQRILKNLNSAHYLQTTCKGNYISSKPGNGIGGNDWCKLSYNKTDSTALSLERPLNTEWDNLDFYIAKDEAFIIVATAYGLAISYPKTNGGWTSPRNLGPAINFGLASWGPYVTPDKKYLFYTTGTKSDYSDTGIFWVRTDHLIDSLKNTNNVPYLQKRLENQAGIVGRQVDFSIPEDSFIDDDGEIIFLYSAILNTGQSIPRWLSFDQTTRRFSGTPAEAGEYTILFTATDKENATGLGVFKLTIKESE